MKKIAGILLAAGSSQRFGSNKLITPLIKNEPMVLTAAKKLRDATDSLTIVVRPGDITLNNLLGSINSNIIENPNANQGMGTSLAAGIRANTDVDGWLIALADMPYINVATYNALMEQLRQNASIVTPVYKGQRGHPVGFASSWHSHLIACTGDKGARDLLNANKNIITSVETDDAGILRDIDTPDDMNYS